MMAAPAVPTACRRRVLTALLLLWALLPAAVARGQAEANRPAFELSVGAAEVVAWQAGDSSVLLLRGNGGRVKLTAGGATLEADDAVVWLTKLPRSARRRADVALVGDAIITTAEGVTRSGPALAVDLLSTGRVAVEAAVRRAADESESPLYQEALAVRDAAAPLPGGGGRPARADSTRDDGTGRTRRAGGGSGADAGRAGGVAGRFRPLDPRRRRHGCDRGDGRRVRAAA